MQRNVTTLPHLRVCYYVPNRDRWFATSLRFVRITGRAYVRRFAAFTWFAVAPYGSPAATFYRRFARRSCRFCSRVRSVVSRLLFFTVYVVYTTLVRDGSVVGSVLVIPRFA